MRHLGSFLLALVFAPATWVLTGLGISKFAEARADSPGLDIDLAVGLAAVIGAGLVYALLILPRYSPLGPVLAGLAFLGLVVWRVVDLDSFEQAVPADVLHVRLLLRYPADGYAAILAMPLLGTLFSARRWRRDEYPPVEYAEVAPAYPAAFPYHPGGDDPTWPFPGDTETTRRL